MAGVYVHIPFCQRRCRYCDFYSTTGLAKREDYLRALQTEWALRKGELKEPIRTIYIGGGTPSVMQAEKVVTIVEMLRGDHTEEITVEVNPGDVNEEYLRHLRDGGVNRLSMGIQSFQDEMLQLIGRRHDALQAKQAVMQAYAAGFDNVSIDLMYGLPRQTETMWQEDIAQAMLLHPTHVSCYCLSYEEGTVMMQWLQEGKVQETDDETLNRMYDTLCQTLQTHRYVHYEVSNFALQGYESKHNSRYWDGTPYIGLGASAHSYDGKVRSWNVSDIDAYISGCLAQNLPREKEELTEEQIHTEQIMLGLRTRRGIDPSLIRDKQAVEQYIKKGLLREQSGRIVATQEGLHILNQIIVDLI